MIRRVLRLVKPALTVEAVTALADGPQRHTDLVRIITVTTGEAVHAPTLGRALRTLQEHGIVEHPAPDCDSAAYRLTSNGHQLVELLNKIERWGQDHNDSLEK
jgi:DNA-binding HxlR family transcriptional regulator